MNKRGASLSSLTEMTLGILLLLGVLAFIIVDMNVQYSKNYDSTFGISTTETSQAFKDYQGTLKTGMEGEATTNAIWGVNVVSSYGIIKAGLSMMFDVVTGSFIQNAVGLLNLGPIGTALGITLRLLFVFAIAFILIKVIFKIKP